MQSQESSLFGICQGRLSSSTNGELQCFPQDWLFEFDIAHNIGFNFIELLVERTFNPQNPVWTTRGRQQIIQASISSSLQLYSICFDYVIDHCLLDPHILSQTKEFLDICNELGVKVVVLPLLEESSLSGKSASAYSSILSELSVYCKSYSFNICIESLLPAMDLYCFLDSLSVSNVFAVFDTGNRAPISSSLVEEVEILSNYIGHVHIKDKNSQFQNVVLGTGLVDFSSVLSSILKTGYKGAFAFETTRGDLPPHETASIHLDYIKQSMP